MRAPLSARLDEIDALMADAGRVDVLGDLVRAEDVSAVWASLSLDRKRAVIDELLTIKLHAVGRGTRTFRAETVETAWRVGE